MRYLLILVLASMIGCASPTGLYKFNYIDQASSAGFSYQRQFDGKVYVCVGEDQAQAYVVEGYTQKWLKVSRLNSSLYPILIVGGDSVLTDTQFCLPLKEFNKLYGS